MTAKWSGGSNKTSGNGATHPTSEGERTRSAVIVPVIKARDGNGSVRTGDARLEEARGLALAIDLEIAFDTIVQLSRPQPATLIGTGKITELARLVHDNSIEVVVVDHPLTPVQQRNLEKALNAKVLDRTGLILEIFGERARTKEGVLQVELAHLNYQRGRLVRSWTHLERQRGGAGFLGGPGETQIEADRRILRDKIVKVRRELETVRRTRKLHRAKRKKVPYPVVAIVGYTNAGKSTLFNRLTGAEVMAKDMLFATLDPTLRRLRLPGGTMVILSDTVGFISDLPTHLVAAFRATLEEVVEADVVLHLRDMSDPDFAAQADDVSRILADLGIDADDPKRVLEVWNKSDLVQAGEVASEFSAPCKGDVQAHHVVVSAQTGDGIEHLVGRIEEIVSGEMETVNVELNVDDAALTDWLYRNSDVVQREDREDGGLNLVIRASHATRGTIEKRLGRPLSR